MIKIMQFLACFWLLKFILLKMPGFAWNKTLLYVYTDDIGRSRQKLSYLQAVTFARADFEAWNLMTSGLENISL